MNLTYIRDRHWDRISPRNIALDMTNNRKRNRRIGIAINAALTVGLVVLVWVVFR